LGVNSGVSSARAGAKTIGVVKVAIVRVGVEAGIEVSTGVRIKVGAKVGIEIDAEERIATTRKIKRTETGSIIRVFRGFEVGVKSSDKS
jgi:hypothetical protein